MQKTIRLSINGTDLAFDVTTELYNKYVNEMMPNNKVPRPITSPCGALRTARGKT